MCRAEAHQLFSRKPIFDALGFKLYAVLHEYIDSEVIAEFKHLLLESNLLCLTYYFGGEGKRFLAPILGWHCTL